MRTYAHIIDTAAVKATLNSIPDYWVVRDLSERDYGIDLMIEIFEELGVDKYSHKTYDATGHICYLQIKGTNTKFDYNKDGTLSYSLDKDSLLYTEKFPTAFILVRVCILPGHQNTFFMASTIHYGGFRF
ncbi:MAG: DUF4365 domain-containing protein [Flavobacterium sp.]|nr:MAG: DUF4365 domain-containing protein [Flavobacterium sp.]